MAILISGDFISIWIQSNLLTWTKKKKERKTVIWGGPFKTLAALSLVSYVCDIAITFWKHLSGLAISAAFDAVV